MKTKALTKLGRSLYKRAPALFMSLGIVSAVGTAVSAIFATKKTIEKIEEAEKDGPITIKEKVKIATPYYISTVLSVGTTVICFVGLNKWHSSRYKALFAGYVSLQQAYDIAKNGGAAGSVGALVGTGALKAASETKQDDIRWFYDPWRQEFFQAKFEDVVGAYYDANHWLSIYGDCSMERFYTFLDREVRPYDEEFGWCIEYLADESEQCWIDFFDKKAEDEEHGTYYIIQSWLNPIHFDSYMEDEDHIYYSGGPKT